MPAASLTSSLGQIPALLRGEVDLIQAWMDESATRRGLLCVGVIVAGAGIYGASMGCWRAPQQALYVAVKFPMALLLTTLGNALLNGMLAPLLGVNLHFRQSLLAILMSFTIAAVILGAFSPVIFFLVWNLPPMTGAGPGDTVVFSLIQVVHTSAIAFAGIAANARLLQLLRRVSGGRPAAIKVLVAWLAGNLFLGSQLCWILRPFFGSPHLEVEFLRPNPLQGNFYDTIFNAVRNMLFS